MTENPALIIREPGSCERIEPLCGEVVRIGRSETNHIILDDPHVSRAHLRIDVEPDQVTFESLVEGSEVLFNGNPRRAGRMRPGDVLRIGRTELVLKGENGAGRPSDRTFSAGIEKARLGLLEEIVKVLPGPTDQEQFFQRILTALFRIMDVRRTFVAMRAGNRGPAQQVAVLNREESGGPVKMSRTIVARVLGSGEGLLASDAMADPELGLSESVVDLGIKSVICVPIQRGQDVVGVLYGDNRSRTKSFGDEELRFMSLIARIVSVQLENHEMSVELREENLRLRRIIDDEEDMIASSPAMKELMDSSRKAAATDATIMITGETGVGKSLLARTIHRLSKRSEEPFVEVSCAAIPDSLLEAEMFGYGPQSGISGANPKGREGYFELAANGTIFLDEIGDMGLILQAKILHAIEEGRIRRLGSNQLNEVRCRIISATNQDLEQAIIDGKFREDLYYRLRVVPFRVPPLRERVECILPLTNFLLRRLSPGRRVRIGSDARSVLLAHHWPGNVRELRNTLSRALALGDAKSIDPDLLRDCLEAPGVPKIPSVRTLGEVEFQHILHVLRLCGGNKKKASEALGISRSTLYAKLKENAHD